MVLISKIEKIKPDNKTLIKEFGQKIKLQEISMRFPAF